MKNHPLVLNTWVVVHRFLFLRTRTEQTTCTDRSIIGILTSTTGFRSDVLYKTPVLKTVVSVVNMAKVIAIVSLRANQHGVYLGKNITTLFYSIINIRDYFVILKIYYVT